VGCAIAQAVVAGFPLRRPEFEIGSDHAGFLVDEMALGQVFPANFIPPVAPQ
jgi:hypothetical protein